MDVLPRGESKKQKRKLKGKLKEVEEEEPMPPGLEELVLTPSPESNESEDYSIRKEGQLESLQRPKRRVFRDYYEEEEEEEGSVGLVERSPISNDSDRVLTPSPVSEDGIIRIFRKEGQRKILQSAKRNWFDYYSDKEDLEDLEEPGWIDCWSGITISAEEFQRRHRIEDKDSPLTWTELFSLDDVDAKTLEANLSVDLHPQPCFTSKEDARKLGYYPNWDELAKYIKQLKENKGFDLDVYENLGTYATCTPQRLSGNLLRYFTGHLRKVLKAAMDFYNEAGGGKLKQGEVIKASNVYHSAVGPDSNPGFDFYINFTAEDCLDGKERHYEARVAYDLILHFASADLVRLKNEATEG